MNPKDKSKILFIGAHPDDVELNCLGTILKWKKDFNIEVYLLICTSGENKSNGFDRKKEQLSISKKYGAVRTLFLDNNDGYLQHNAKLVSEIETVIKELNPDTVFTHSLNDHHQDHIAVSKATISAIREIRVNLLFYPSITSTNHFNDQDNYSLVVDITKELKDKLRILSQYKSQKNTYYFNPRYISDSNKTVSKIDTNYFTEKFSIGIIQQ